MVNSNPAFPEHLQFSNRCSEVLAEVFGPERGVGALPGDIAVEVEAIFELR